eukprot:XP_011456219.1 PREDICTED: uncharacterized protein LOC105348475 isoform X3 [Crassostrea gigas]
MITLPNYPWVLHYAVVFMMNTLSVVKVTGQICTSDMEGQGEFDVSCGNRSVSPNNSVSDKTPKQHDERLPDKLWRIVSLVLISVLMCLCFVLLIIVVLLRKRQIRGTTESSKAATPMSRSIFYMINNNEDSTFSTQNEYEQLRISSLHVYNEVSLKLIPAPTSYINLSSLK